MTREYNVRTILPFLVGAAVGAVAALLLAPKSGKELRGDIADGVSDGVNQIRSTGKDLKERAQQLVGLTKDHVQNAIEAGHNAYSDTKKA